MALNTRKLLLADLGVPGSRRLTSAMGTVLAEAAAVSLEAAQHRSGVAFRIDGDASLEFELLWHPATQQMRDSYADPGEAVEFGACGIALLVVEQTDGLTVLTRSCKGTGFDYWLGTDDNPSGLFQKCARLEVSGMAAESGTNTVAARVEQKLVQTEQSDDTLLPAIAVVVLFATPRVHKETRE